MKRFIAIFAIALTCTIASAQEVDESKTASVPSKSIFSIDVGYVSDGKTGHGYGVSLGFPASSPDGALTFAPVIRPYNSLTGEWDFSRSYFNVSLALRFKSSMEVKKLPWNYYSVATKSKGAI